MSECIYCESHYIKDTEHVFPFGLGGEDVFCNFVCEVCNGKFSVLEGELYQKSIIALQRSIEGLDGYSSLKNKSSELKVALLLVHDEKEDIVFEIGQYNGMQPFLRPQIIKIKDAIYLEGDSIEGCQRLIKIFEIWAKSNLKLVLGNEINKSVVRDYFQIQKQDDRIIHLKINEHLKVRNEIRLDFLSDSHKIFNSLTPRVFLDTRDKNKDGLRMRAKNDIEALDFILELLDWMLKKRPLSSYSNKNLEAPMLHFGINFDGLKLERALIKIGMNCLMTYFPESRNNVHIRHCIQFVVNGDIEIDAKFESKNELIDAEGKKHSVFFYQMQNLFIIRINLFNGKFVYSFNVPKLHLIPINTFKRLVIDYERRRNTFESESDFFNTFST